MAASPALPGLLLPSSPAISPPQKASSHETRFRELISLCISNRALDMGQRLRSDMASLGYKPSLFLDNQFINLYSKCAEVEMARELFDFMAERNVVSWNTLLAGYCLNACLLDAVYLFLDMVESGPRPNYVTYLAALRASVGLRSLELGKQIHCWIVKTRCLSHIELGNALINMYSELARPEAAEAVHGTMAERDVISWNSIISDGYTFVSLLGWGDTEFTEELHAQVITRGLQHGVILGSALLEAYARCKNTRAAMVVFDSMSKRNAVTWNSILDACFESNMLHEGLRMFLRMGQEGLAPDEFTISIMLKAAATTSTAAVGKQMNAMAVKMGLHMNTMIGNSLITMYAKHGQPYESLRAFNAIEQPDLISWNSLIQSYVQNAKFDQALDFFIDMKHARIEPDERSYTGAMDACASLGWHQTGREVHSDLIKRGMSSNSFVGSALIDMYSKSTALDDARKVFDSIENKDIVAWNSIISGFSQNNHLDRVLDFLRLMREENMEPDNFTFSAVLASSANATAVHLGRQVHAMIMKHEMSEDVAVANSLITMYSKTGSIEEARRIFNQPGLKTVVSWTAMIGGLAQNGCCKEALETFARMAESKVMPNGRTFIELFTACSYAGMSSEAAEYFGSMETKYGIGPDVEHYACMVDILGRAGRLQEAEDLIKGMPFEADALVWRMLLGACRIYGDVERGRRSMERIVALEPGDSAAYVLLSNLHGAVGNWEDVVETRGIMRRKRVIKETGKSWIELRDGIHEFSAGDRSHPQTNDIYVQLDGLFKQLRDEGYDAV